MVQIVGILAVGVGAFISAAIIWYPKNDRWPSRQ